MAQLCSTPKSISRLAVQFAAKSQGKLKTKATMLIASQWLKVGGEKYIAPPEEEGSTPSLDLAYDEAGLFTANALMSARSSTGDDASVSELSESTTPGDEENEESNVIFDSEDLDRTTKDERANSIDNNSARVSRESDASRSTVSSTATTDTRASQQQQGTTGSTNRSLKKQNSHPELNSAKISSNNNSASASMSTLPELILPAAGSSGTPPGPLSTSRARTKSSAPAMSQRANNVVASSNSASLSRPSLSQQAVSSSAPQAIIRPPVESSPYVSYVDNDGPELPDSAQSTLVYLAPNAFAIQTAAISGDEVAKLRAENMDKNLKLSLLGKQVSVLEKRLAETTAQAEESAKKEKELNAEVATLAKRVRRLRKNAKSGLSDSTLDESASTSSGGVEESGSGKKRKRKEKVSGDDNASTVASGKKVFWTPEEERRGLVLLFAIAMLAVLFFCSPAFQSTLYSVVDALGFGSTSNSNNNGTDLALPGATASAASSDAVATSANLFTSAANEFSSAFASALNISANEADAPA